MVGGMRRVVEAEILDELPAWDPAARASRADLRRINFLMGNERWILRQARGMAGAARRGIVEWGAGSGELLRKLSSLGPAGGVDLAERPAGLPEGVAWRQADVFADDSSGGVLVANLFLHHFEQDGLRRLGRRMEGFEAVVVVEPWRSRTALALGRAILPMVSPVTRHDMLVSIRAGFRPGELATALGLDGCRWKISESVDFRGGLRWCARQRDDRGGAAVARC